MNIYSRLPHLQVLGPEMSWDSPFLLNAWTRMLSPQWADSVLQPYKGIVHGFSTTSWNDE